MIAQLLTPTHLTTILVVLLLLFGPRRLPQTGRALGRGIREFTEAVTGHQASKDKLPSPDHYDGEPQPLPTKGPE